MLVEARLRFFVKVNVKRSLAMSEVNRIILVAAAYSDYRMLYVGMRVDAENLLNVICFRFIGYPVVLEKQ